MSKHDSAFVTNVLVGVVILQSAFIITIGLTWLYVGGC